MASEDDNEADDEEDVPALFPCPAEGCGKTFETEGKLRVHTGYLFSLLFLKGHKVMANSDLLILNFPLPTLRPVLFRT